MVHDWLSHGGGDTTNPPHQLPLPPGDDWPSPGMTILRTLPDDRCCPADQGQPATYRNTETHWWDGSQIYGSDLARQRLMRTDPATGQLRPDGKIHLDAQGHLPVDATSDPANLELSGVNGNWWVGLSALHTLFAREHNAIVDRLRVDYPTADGEWLFQKARLVNAALIAKIHTVEWTPALMNSPEGRIAMRGNFWGLLGEHYAHAYGRLGDGEILSGIPGSPTNHHSAPYAMTEEFTAVYRMHSLLPDAFSFRRHQDGGEIAACDFMAVAGGSVRDLYGRVPSTMFSTPSPPAIPGAGAAQLPQRVAQAAREGAPSSSTSRRPTCCATASAAFRATAPSAVTSACACPRASRSSHPIPNGSASLPRSTNGRAGRPAGRIALRDGAAGVRLLRHRLPHLHPDGVPAAQSDRFFTADFTPEVYTPAGFAWIQDNSMRTVLERHCRTAAAFRQCPQRLLSLGTSGRASDGRRCAFRV